MFELIIGAVIVIMLVNAAFRTAERITVATETTAITMASLYAALSPEARARADEYFREAKRR
jgi:uncharacterized membrane protein